MADIRLSSYSCFSSEEVIHELDIINVSLKSLWQELDTINVFFLDIFQALSAFHFALTMMTNKGVDSLDYCMTESEEVAWKYLLCYRSNAPFIPALFVL